MAFLTWQDLANAAFSEPGLLTDLLNNADDPNTVLKQHGKETLSDRDVERWTDLVGANYLNMEPKQVLGLIATLVARQGTQPEMAKPASPVAWSAS